MLEKLKDLPDNSVDSIVTDPPYELGFMGKSWDSTGIANNVDMWKECLRVLKPGGHLLAFSGTRTYHRMASAIEDAGFEVRDMIETGGQVLPKDQNRYNEGGKPKATFREGTIRNFHAGNYVVLWSKDRGSGGTKAISDFRNSKKIRNKKTKRFNCKRWFGTGGK